MFQRRRCGELNLSTQRSFKIWFDIRYTRPRYTIQVPSFPEPQSTRREPDMYLCMAEDCECKLLVRNWSEVAVHPGSRLSCGYASTPICHLEAVAADKSRSMTSSFRFKSRCRDVYHHHDPYSHAPLVISESRRGRQDIAHNADRNCRNACTMSGALSPACVCSQSASSNFASFTRSAVARCVAVYKLR